MRRLGLPLLALAVVVALLVGVVVLAAGDGPYAFKVRSHAVSQSEIDADLGNLADHPDFAAGLVGEQVSPGAGSVPSNLSAGWLMFRVVTTYAIDELARRSERVTAADRSATGLESAAGFDELPSDLRDRLLRGFSSLRALQRVLAGDPASDVQALVLEGCPSGRFVSHILVETEAEAEEIVVALDGGAEFADLAVERSTDPGSAPQGGQLGCLDALGDTVAPFLAAMTALPVNTVSVPVQTEFGFHLILVSDFPAQDDLDAVTIGIVLRGVARERVQVDPRYGTWDAENGQVLPPGVTSAAG